MRVVSTTSGRKEATDQAIDGHLRANDAKYVEIPVERKYLHFSFESIISLTEINAYFLRFLWMRVFVDVLVFDDVVFHSITMVRVRLNGSLLPTN